MIAVAHNRGHRVSQITSLDVTKDLILTSVTPAKVISFPFPGEKGSTVKYFFLSEGWIVGRVWEFGGIWDEMSWRRKPHIKRLNLGMVERGQVLWLHEAEDNVLMVEVMPTPDVSKPGPFGQVILSRLLAGEQVVECLGKADGVVKINESSHK